MPLIFSLTIDLTEPQNRGKKFGSLSAVYVLGNGLGQILSGFLIDYYPWQIPILIIAVSGFVCMGLLFLVNEPLRGAKDDIYRINDEDFLGLKYRIKLVDFKYIWNIKSTVWILILNFTMFISIGAISSFFIAMLKNDYNISSTLATGLLILVFGSQIPSGPVIGSIGDSKFEKEKNGRMKVVLICLLMGSICYIIAFSLFFLSNAFISVIILLIFSLAGAFLFGGVDPLTQAILGEINPPQIRSTIYSINFLTYTIGRSISLLILSHFFLIFNNFYSTGYFFLAIMALICTLILIPILKNLPQDIDNLKSR